MSDLNGPNPDPNLPPLSPEAERELRNFLLVFGGVVFLIFGLFMAWMVHCGDKPLFGGK